MLHRIREAMQPGPISVMFTGVVVADETYIGGTEKFKHAWKRDPKASGRGTKKTPVLSLVDKDSGEVRSRVIPNITGITLRKAIELHCDPSRSTLHADKLPSYNLVGKQLIAHEAVDHEYGDYVRGDVSTNQCENFFSQLKRSIDGTHHNVSREHLNRHLAEFDYRHSTRKMNDASRMERLMAQTGGRRLMYTLVTR